MKKKYSYTITQWQQLSPLIKKVKRMTKTIMVAFLIHSANLFIPQEASAQISVNFEIFYNTLSPYGNWIDHPNYGYVWTPRVSRGFSPYGSRGHWVYTVAGWTWVSNYSWGWAPFHYGRWFNDKYYGWLWVPDYDWGPGWVSWRKSAGFYGWAPIGPGIEIGFAYSSGYNIPSDDWRFVRDLNFGRTDIDNYYAPVNSYGNLIRNSQPINNIQKDNQRNIIYNVGPERAEVEKRSSKSFSPVMIKEINEPGQNLRNNQLEIYRPKLQPLPAERKIAPSKVLPYKGVQPASQKPEHTPTKLLPAKQQPSKQPEKNKPPKKGKGY